MRKESDKLFLKFLFFLLSIVFIGAIGIALCCYFEKGMSLTTAQYIEKEREDIKLFRNVNSIYKNKIQYCNEIIDLPSKIVKSRGLKGRKRYIYVFEEFYLKLKNLVESSEKFNKKNKEFILEAFINPDILWYLHNNVNKTVNEKKLEIFHRITHQKTYHYVYEIECRKLANHKEGKLKIYKTIDFILRAIIYCKNKDLLDEYFKNSNIFDKNIKKREIFLSLYKNFQKLWEIQLKMYKNSMIGKIDNFLNSNL